VNLTIPLRRIYATLMRDVVFSLAACILQISLYAVAMPPVVVTLYHDVAVSYSSWMHVDASSDDLLSRDMSAAASG